MIILPMTDIRIGRRHIPVIATAVLIGLSGHALARGTDPAFGPTGRVAFHAYQAPTIGQSVITSRGPAFITGHLGALETTTLPGSGGQGFLMNNGNGTSTLITLGAPPQTVATPR